MVSVPAVVQLSASSSGQAEENHISSTGFDYRSLPITHR